MAVNFFSAPAVYWRRFFERAPFSGGDVCYLCDAPLEHSERLVCAPCTRDLPFIGPACPVCATPGQASLVCAACLNSQRLFVERSVSVFLYEYPVNRLVADLKYRARLPLAGYFARLLAATVNWHGLAAPEQLVPIPLHRSRLAARGFNQAQAIAARLSSFTGIPVNHGSCRRRIATQPQSGLPAVARRRNLRNAFSVIDSSSLARHVAIVDDVVTTGTTVQELAKSLMKAGVERVDVWSCCRARR